MNTRQLLIVMAILLGVGFALTARSTLTPERGADHVFYAAGEVQFMGQYAVVGDFNNDGFDDWVSSIRWDDPAVGGVTLKGWTKTYQCLDSPPEPEPKAPWRSILAQKGGVKRRVCDFPGEFGDRHWEYWEDLGWTMLASGPCDTCFATVQCDSCYSYEINSEDQGALHVVDGDADWTGDWDHDNDFASTPSDHFITGKSPGDVLYTGLAVGRINADAYDDLVVAASNRASAKGEIYVIEGGTSDWPSTINLASTGLVEHTITGRETADEFGYGVAAGDLDMDGQDDIIVSAPGGDGTSASPKSNSGEIYIFYTDGVIPIPSTVNLSGLSDGAVDSLGYVSVIYGPTAGATVGVTTIQNTHAAHQGHATHNGFYHPIGLAVGDWDGDGNNDLAIGAGKAQGDDGAVYVIFGGGSKLVPGNRIDLNVTPSTSPGAPDVKITGKTDSYLGAGVAFVDADDEGTNAEDDLIIGAPLTTSGGKTERGEAYIILGESSGSLTANRTITVTDSLVDVKIIGEDAGDRFGSQFEGEMDIDGDGTLDVGATGEAEQYVFFVEPGGVWDAVVDLYDIETDSPAIRVIEMAGLRSGAVTTPHSVTIRFADIDNDGYRDLVFGGYDLPGSPGTDAGAYHAGQMWVTKGTDMWQSGYVTGDTDWSGNVFVHGDIVIDNGATLTIAPGTDVWMWRGDPANLGVDAGHVEFRIEDGELIADGTADEKIRFLAWTTDDVETDAVNGWWGFWLDDVDPTSATFDHVVIRNALRGIATRSPVTITNSVIEDVALYGIFLAGDGVNTDSVHVENTTIRRVSDAVDGTGLKVLGDGAVLKAVNTIIRDVASGIDVTNGGKVYADVDVSDTALWGIEVRGGADATIIGSRIESTGDALIVTSGSNVYGGLSEFINSAVGAVVLPDTGSAPSAEFAECRFDSNGVGAFVASTSNVEFDECLVGSNEDEGVYCYGGADIDILDCTMGGNTVNVRADNSDPTINGNYLGEAGAGISCQNYAVPSVIENKVWNNTNGITFATNADADMDNSNSFKGNTAYHFANLTGTTIDATINYWGKTTPSAAKFTGPVNYTPWLTTDPLPTSDAPLEAKIEMPVTYALRGGAPNPFNPVTTIRYEVPPPGGPVRLRIYNVRGQLVRTLVNRTEAAGHHHVQWNGINEHGNEVASGVYFLEMVATQFRATHKIMMLK